MGKYFEKFDNTVKYDEIFGGGDGFPVEIANVKVASGTTITKGTILAAENLAGTFSLATASDTAKTLVIAAENFTATSSDETVTQAYTSGRFNRNKLIANTETTVTALELPLRTQNIILTSIKEVF